MNGSFVQLEFRHETICERFPKIPWHECDLDCLCDSNVDPFDGAGRRLFRGKSPFLIPLLLNWRRLVNAVFASIFIFFA
jgi:hypothetical protein